MFKIKKLKCSLDGSLNQAYKQCSNLSSSESPKTWVLLSSAWVKLKLKLNIKLLRPTSNTNTSLSSLKYYQAHSVWMNDPNSHLIKDLVIYEFIFQAHIKLFTKPINEHRLDLFFINSYCSQGQAYLNIFFSLGSICLLNKPKTKAHA